MTATKTAIIASSIVALMSLILAYLFASENIALAFTFVMLAFYVVHKALKLAYRTSQSR